MTRHIVYDYDVLSKRPLSFRSSPLLEACARNMILHARETDCAVVRRLRDEQGYAPFTEDRTARADNLKACLEAGK